MIRGGGLFTRYFLEEGIRETDAYRSADPARILAFADAVRGRWAELAEMSRHNEGVTESEFIYKLINLLSWLHLPKKEPGRVRRDEVDALQMHGDSAHTQARHPRSL